MHTTSPIAVVVPVYNEGRVADTLAALHGQQRRHEVHHYIVDNGSTDDTRARIDAFARTHDDFPLTVLEEATKGTGAASDTGFRRAIDDGYVIVARTDGDSMPTRDWTTRIDHALGAGLDIQLLGGRSTAMRDRYYRRADRVLLPLAVTGARLALSIQHRNGDYRRAVVGHNMATRARAYEMVGGFVRTAIDDCDEDVDYSLKIARVFGRAAIQIDPQLEVATSMRRVRTYGIAGTAFHHLVPARRVRRGRDIDVR